MSFIYDDLKNCGLKGHDFYQNHLLFDYPGIGNFLDIYNNFKNKKLESELFIINWVITLGYDYIPLEFVIRYTLGLLRNQWEFFYAVLGELLNHNFQNFKDLGMMETIAYIKNIDHYAYFNWDKVFKEFGI